MMQSPSVSASTQGPPLSPSSTSKPPELPGTPVCLSLYLSFSVPVCLSSQVHLSVSSVCLSQLPGTPVCLSTHLSLYLCLSSKVHLSAYLSLL